MSRSGSPAGRARAVPLPSMREEKMGSEKLTFKVNYGDYVHRGISAIHNSQISSEHTG